MRDKPFFLKVENVLAIRRRMIQEFGGDSQLRDRSFLESAVNLPAARFKGRYLHAGIPAMAAAYLFHLCQNHSFVDGSKRTALTAAEIFLLVNGYTLSATNAELEKLTLGVAKRKISKIEAISFFRNHAQASLEQG